MKKYFDKTPVMFHVDTENLKKLKIMAIKSNLTYMEVINDIIQKTIDENEIYKLKNEKFRLNILN